MRYVVVTVVDAPRRRVRESSFADLASAELEASRQRSRQDYHNWTYTVTITLVECK